MKSLDNPLVSKIQPVKEALTTRVGFPLTGVFPTLHSIELFMILQTTIRLKSNGEGCNFQRSIFITRNRAQRRRKGRKEEGKEGRKEGRKKERKEGRKKERKEGRRKEEEKEGRKKERKEGRKKERKEEGIEGKEGRKRKGRKRKGRKKERKEEEMKGSFILCESGICIGKLTKSKRESLKGK